MKRAENQPERSLCLYAGIYALTWTVPDRGTLLPQHAHRFDHVSFIVSGVVRVWCDGELLGEFAGPHALKIPARSLHSFLTMSDNVTILCIHNADHIEAGEPALHAEHNLELED
jgi:mannose-6-phosphate isomerase-like protein (cupin superfamily)